MYLLDLFLRKSLVPLNSLRRKNNSSDLTLTTELRNRVQLLPTPTKSEVIHNQWLENIIKLKNQILTKDPKNFLQWGVIRKTMFIGNAFFTIPEFFYLRKHNWQKWRKAILEKNFVLTEPYLLYPKTSGNLVHHAYHLALFEQITGKKIKDLDFVFEYGGGYGNMCQLIHNLGFKGKYVIFDLPILTALQTFFLKINNLNASNKIDRKAKILCLDNINALKKVIPKKGKKLFIATWSLSESPPEIRKKVYPLIEKINAQIIGYQHDFSKVDNHEYFKKYQRDLGKLQWWNQEISHLKNNYYLFGFK